MPKLKLTISFFLFTLFLPLAFVSAGTIISPHKYAWSSKVGYINFENVVVTDSTLSGYAWSANKGFIKFNSTLGGVFNDGTGNLSGSAWGEQLGWIDFDGVSINSSTGIFSGTATSDLVGIINFDCPTFCDVETDWRGVPTPTTPTVTPSSSGGGGNGPPILNLPPPSLPDLVVADSSEAKLVDIEKDGIINILDFNTLMVNWGGTQNLASVGSVFSPADTNKDGVVDIFDFNTLMVYWGITYQL